MTETAEQRVRVEGTRFPAAGAQLADASLVLEGVRLPWTELGRGESRDTRSLAAQADPLYVELRVGRELAAKAVLSGALVMLDPESTPVAVIDDPVRVNEHTVGGRIRADRTQESAAFGDLRVPPAAMPPRGRARIVVLAGRPPMRADISQVLQLGREPGAEVVWIVPVASPTPDGVPPSVLVRTAKAAAGMVIGSRVIATPMWWRDPLRDRALAEAVAEAYGGTHLVLLDPAAAAPAEPYQTPAASALSEDPSTESNRLAWAKLHRALQAGTDVPDVAPAGVLAELRRWRPARGRRGLVILFTGLSGSGKSTLARRLVDRLTESSERSITLLDGDVVRALLSSGLGFDRDSRDLNVRRIGFVAAEVARHGGIAVCAPIAPYQSSRDAVRSMAEAVGDFVLIHVATSLEVCEQRDLKGLYAKARAGLVAEFTGVSDPYDIPRDADMTIDTSSLSQEAGVAQVLTFLQRGGWLNHPEGA